MEAFRDTHEVMRRCSSGMHASVQGGACAQALAGAPPPPLVLGAHSLARLPTPPPPAAPLSPGGGAHSARLRRLEQAARLAELPG